jgi:cytochrome P450
MVTQSREKNAKAIPSIKELPVLGSALVHYGAGRFDLYRRITHECGDIGLFHMGPYRVIQIASSELMHSLLVEHANDFDKGEIAHKVFRSITGNGLFINEGQAHRRQRKLMSPFFQPRHIVGYADTMASCTEEIQQHWRTGETLDMDREMMALTMSIVGKVLFDVDVFTQADELGAAVWTLAQHILYLFANPFALPLDWPTPRNKKVRHAQEVLGNKMQQMIAEREAKPDKGDDILSVLLQARDEDGIGMSNEQLRAECLTLFNAGHDTTASALTWSWYLLASHPDAYHTMQQEIDTVLQGRSPASRDLARLPYTLQVLLSL